VDVTLLGTGAGDGWPNPFCDCASCRAARRSGRWRAQTAALVDGRLLFECGAGLPAAAARHGVELAGVRHVLVTHAHPDHWQPQVLASRAWSSTASGRLELIGPPAVARSAAAAGLDVDRREIGPGDRLDVGGYVVRALPAAHGTPADGPAVLYDVAGPDGSRMLWATDTGPLPPDAIAATEHAGYDGVFLDETDGDGPAERGSGQHLGLASFAAVVADLRRAGAVTATTRICAVHLGHRNPPEPRLAERLAAWGAEAPDDGALVSLGRAGPAAGRRSGGRVLVLGGARSGKSAHAERLLLAEPAVTYVATGPTPPGDEEWAARVAAHRQRRPARWRTVETADLAAVLRSERGPLLVDCVSTWLAGLLDRSGAFAPDAGDPAEVDARVGAAIDELVAAWAGTQALVVAVSSEVGSGVVPATAAGRRFRDDLGRLNALLAEAADDVWLVTAGVAQRLT
jgi:adenosylcobinamide kinase/adenosylcobinamide-phosphate guanylyltransferase